jgi:hypothetical protein
MYHSQCSVCPGLSVIFFVIVLKIYCLAAVMSGEQLLPAGESVPVCNIHVKLDVMCCKKRGKHAVNITHAIQIPEMMIHTGLKSAQGIETKAVTS